MVLLRHFTAADADVLQRYYSNMPLAEIQKTIGEWNRLVFNGKYFEMFAVVFDGQVVGMLSLFELSGSVISVGEEIFSDFRRKGFGEKAVLLALKICKEKGYKIACNQTGSGNLASISMQKKLGFETDGYGYINKKGQEVFLFLKAL